MRRNAAVLVAVVVTIAAAAGIIVFLTGDRSKGARPPFPAAAPFPATTPAAAPFDAFREARVAVGDRCLRVLVAATPVQRSRGLRDVRELAPYEGMLFVHTSDTAAKYTMANTPMPLDIVWFAADGTPVDHTTMTPCPDGTDATCPVYASRTRYRYTLERPAGATGGGSLGSCAS